MARLKMTAAARRERADWARASEQQRRIAINIVELRMSVDLLRRTSLDIADQRALMSCDPERLR